MPAAVHSFVKAGHIGWSGEVVKFLLQGLPKNQQKFNWRDTSTNDMSCKDRADLSAAQFYRHYQAVLSLS